MEEKKKPLENQLKKKTFVVNNRYIFWQNIAHKVFRT